MKLYKYWVKQTGTLNIEGVVTDALFYGKSNLSVDDARSDANAQANAVQKRIDGKVQCKSEYDVPIREEIVHTLDSRNLVTRNRYGALVLNSEDLLFIDIDQPKFSFFQTLFGKAKGSRKDQIVSMVALKASKADYKNLGFRLYETKAGVRVIVQGFEANPVGKKVMKLMKEFNADPLYAILCEKQQCYRARLTPKPVRIRCKTPRVVFPRNEKEETAHQEWIQTYDQLSVGYSVCTHIKDIGPFRESGTVRYHDQQTRAKERHPLA